MNIALIFPPLYGVDLPPMGLAYVASALIRDGHKVKVFCFNFSLYKENPDKKKLWDWSNSHSWLSYEGIAKNFEIDRISEGWVKEILEFNPQAAGFSVNTHSAVLSNLLADKIKNKRSDITTVFGGPFCSASDGRSLNQNVDIYVKGEGEIIASLIFRRLEAKEAIDDIKGTVIKKNGGFKDNGVNDAVALISKLPFPGLQLFDFNNYDNQKDIPILFSRGCNYYCRFCCDKPIWGNYRMRDAEDIAAEIIKHKDIFGRSSFKCNDLLVNGNLSELERLADLITQKNLNITWGGMARARSDMPDGLLRKLKLSGCAYLTFGIESGSSKVLKFMGKPSPKDSSLAIRRTHNAGIKVNTLWMVGHPGETLSDIIKTIFFLFRNRKYIDEFVNVSLCYIPPNSLLDAQSKRLEIDYDQSGNWYIKKSKNTYGRRKARAKILMFFAGLFGLYTGGIRSDY